MRGSEQNEAVGNDSGLWYRCNSVNERDPRLLNSHINA